MTVTLSFTISGAIPDVAVPDIQWVYSPDFSVSPFMGTDDTDITNLTHRVAMTSSYTFSSDLLSLTITNIAIKACTANEPTDRGRYFLVATNPAGPSFSYIDLLVDGKSYHISIIIIISLRFYNGFFNGEYISAV